MPWVVRFLRIYFKYRWQTGESWDGGGGGGGGGGWSEGYKMQTFA